MPVMGDTLLVRTELREPKSTTSFDYSTYLLRQGIVATAYAARWRVIGENHRPWYQSARGWQQRLIELYRELGIEGEEEATLSALTLGYRENLDIETRQAFAAAGATHILAVSGLHTGIVFAVLLALLTCFGRFKPYYDETGKRLLLSATIILLLWFYAAITGWTPSVVRSVLMCMFVSLAWSIHRHNSINIIFATAFFILLVRPQDLYSMSFQLSFAAVTAIVLFVPGFNKLLPVPHTWPNWVGVPLRYVRDIITVSMAAQIGTMPITIYYFGQFSTYFLLTNLLVLPLTFIIISLALVTIVLGALWPTVGMIAANGLKWCVWGLNHYVGWIESLPHATITINTSLPLCLSIVAAILFAYLALQPKRWSLLWLIPELAALGAIAYFY